MKGHYEWTGATLDEALAGALEKAKADTPPPPGTDFISVRVVDFGVQWGGIAKTTDYWAIVAVDGTGPHTRG